MKAMLVLIFSTIFCQLSYAQDKRDAAVMRSKLVKAIIKGLKQEQNLTCVLATDESGRNTIQYYYENDLSKFRVLFVCAGGYGRSALISGVIGDSGQTAVEKFSMEFAN